jgi:membrane associated rhomboid family serine protease
MERIAPDPERGNMPTWDEITPYTERSTLSKHASVTNALLSIHLLALGVAVALHIAGREWFLPAVELRVPQTIVGLELWRLFSFPFAHTPEIGPIIVFGLLGWMFYRAGNELEREWGGARMLGFCMAMALYAGLAHALYYILSGAVDDPLRPGARGFEAPVLGALRNPRRPALLFLILPVRAMTLFWAIFVATLLFGVLTLEHHIGSSPVAVAGAVAAAWVYTFLDPRFDRLFQWLETRHARAQFLEEFELRGQVDAILEKIQHSGMDSLTRRERRLLKRASRLFQTDARRSHE